MADNYIAITPDASVTKQIITQGSGEPPPLHARCLVHYVARLADGGEVVFDSRSEQRSGNEPAQVVAGRTSALRGVGLNLGVVTMLKGERCRLHVAPQYGYGEAGNFSFPAVPPNAHLEYEVELVAWEAAEEGRPQEHMTYEERLEAADRRRLEGNQLFKAGSHSEATAKYTLALSYLDEDFLMQLEGPHLDKANAVKLPLHLNLAACESQSGQWRAALEHCEEVLVSQPDNSKAIFRRGRAQLRLGNSEAAERDLLRAARLAPQNVAIKRELAALHRLQREERMAQSKLFKGRLPRPAQPAAQPANANSTVNRIWAFLRMLWSFVFPAASWQTRDHTA